MAVSIELDNSMAVSLLSEVVDAGEDVMSIVTSSVTMSVESNATTRTWQLISRTKVIALCLFLKLCKLTLRTNSLCHSVLAALIGYSTIC